MDHTEEPPPDDNSEFLEALRLKATRTLLASFIEWSTRRVVKDTAGAIEEAIQRFPSSGKIRGRRERLTVRAIVFLLQELPATHEDRDDLTARVEGLVARTR